MTNLDCNNIEARVSTPIRRSDLEEFAEIVKVEVTNFLSYVLSPENNIFSVEHCRIVERYLSENFDVWYGNSYNSYTIDVHAPWLDMDVCSHASYFNITLKIWEFNFEELNVVMTFKVSARDSGFNVDKKYVWYE